VFSIVVSVYCLYVFGIVVYYVDIAIRPLTTLMFYYYRISYQILYCSKTYGLFYVLL